MTISDSDYKLLWGRAGGFCSNTTCGDDLTIILERKSSFNVGEMAHIIAHSEGGPRGRPGGGSDDYSNLILLCPTCHRKIDKAPEGIYTEQMLLDWKVAHEAKIRERAKAPKFEEIAELKRAVSRKLQENKQIWATFGPNSVTAQNDPDSNLCEVWALRKLSTIVPNNAFIINCISNNENLLNSHEFEEFLKFKDHAISFERNQYGRLDSYPLFPATFAEAFRDV